MEGITDTGLYFNPQRTKELKKDVYNHYWIMVATYTLSRTEVLEATRGENVNLDPESLANLSAITCARCELPWGMSSHRECPGEPVGYDPKTGRPEHHQRWVREAFKLYDKGEMTDG